MTEIFSLELGFLTALITTIIALIKMWKAIGNRKEDLEEFRNVISRQENSFTDFLEKERKRFLDLLEKTYDIQNELLENTKNIVAENKMNSEINNTKLYSLEATMKNSISQLNADITDIQRTLKKYVVDKE